MSQILWLIDMAYLGISSVSLNTLTWKAHVNGRSNVIWLPENQTIKVQSTSYYHAILASWWTILGQFSGLDTSSPQPPDWTIYPKVISTPWLASLLISDVTVFLVNHSVVNTLCIVNLQTETFGTIWCLQLFWVGHKSNAFISVGLEFDVPH